MGWSMSSCLLKIRSSFINWFVGDSALVVRWLLDDFDALPTVRSILKILYRGILVDQIRFKNWPAFTKPNRGIGTKSFQKVQTSIII